MDLEFGMPKKSSLSYDFDKEQLPVVLRSKKKRIEQIYDLVSSRNSPIEVIDHHFVFREASEDGLHRDPDDLVNIGDTSSEEIFQDKNTSSSEGKGKAVLKFAQEESRGPQTRNIVCRKAILDKDAEEKPVNGDSTSEIY
ncbi:hypothetical protein VNO80_06832 [Phaseolus coccineus]|uniref:Uncharacterized protein n=1 Tax=Phaseolus coccineus TaxID=3886 RepID=A0AAN9NHJ7_PHACN